ncbi:MAG: glycosyltransferase family 4 protein [Cyanobacteria bacterium J06641_5]
MYSQLRVGFLSSSNYFDRRAWSGTLYYMYRSLSALPLQVVPLGIPQKTTGLWAKIADRLPKPVDVHSEQEGSPRELRKRFAQHLQAQKKFARIVRRQLRRTPCDVIFAPAASSDVFVLKDDIDVPLVYLSDTTFKLLSKNYSQRYAPEAAGWLERAEEASLAKAAKIIFPSSWAVDSAISDYHVSHNVVEAIPFGANIDCPDNPADCERGRGPMDPCRLLFIGREWHRKGGDVAVEALRALHARGVKATLTIVGCTPPEGYSVEGLEGLEIIPYLDKNKPEHRQQFMDLLSQSHLFLLPTRADCSPIVTFEANAFGLPVVTTDVGGLPEIVTAGKNGYTLPHTATGADFAGKIAEIMAEPEAYQKLIRTSRGEYDNRFGWQAWGKRVRPILEQAAKRRVVDDATDVISSNPLDSIICPWNSHLPQPTTIKL